MRIRAVARQFETVAAVFREPRLRRLEVAWGGHYLAEWAHFVALSIYAFEAGGAAAVGLLGFVRMGAAAAALPFGSVLTDRYPRQRVLLGSYLARAALLGVVALALAEGSPRGVVFVLAGLAAVVAAPVRPSTLSLVPLIARTPQELVAANVSSSTMEGLGTLAGPLVGGVLTAALGADAAVAAAAAVCLGGAVVVLRIRREGEVALRMGSGRGVAAELMRGVRTLADEPRPRLVVFLFASQALVRGLLNVLLTVAALGVLDVGRSGVGWLNAALGFGGLVGGLATVQLVARRRLAAPFAGALVLWGAPLALVGVAPNLVTAFTCIAVIGLGNALLDVAGFTLLQRTVDDHVLGRVFGVFEILVAAGVALGSALGSLAVAGLGIRGALVASGLLLPALALVSWSRLRAIDAHASVPEPQLSLVAGLPLFAPLPVTTLERLAFRLRPERAAAGTTIVHEGTAGGRFYLVASGEVSVTRDGIPMRTLHAGDHFGEIALLRTGTRTATCTALTDAELYALDRETFVAAVSGDLRSAAAAQETVDARLDGDPGYLPA